MQTPTRTTELEAVNIMLGLLGETPVNNLIPPYGVDVANARKLLYDFTKSVQVRGWKFNVEKDYTLVRNIDNEIVFPSNLYSVDANNDPSVDVVFRSGKLYDLKNHRFTFDHDIVAEVKWLFPFDEIPECARQYIKICAARSLQERFVGSDVQEFFTRDDENKALITLQHEEGESGDYNVLNQTQAAYTTRRYESARRYR